MLASCVPDGGPSHTNASATSGTPSPLTSGSRSPCPSEPPVANLAPSVSVGPRTKTFGEIDLDAFGRLADKAGWDRVKGRALAAEARDAIRDRWPVARDRLPDDQRAHLERHQASLRL